MLQIVLATRNQNKAVEIRKILEGLNIELLTLQDFPNCPGTIEDGKTLCIQTSNDKGWQD